MAFDPTDYKTWTSFSDHPIFGETKHAIDQWSHDPSRYDDLNSYTQFLPQWYVHVDPAPPESEQLKAARRDIAQLCETCTAIESAFSPIRYELVVLDDFTVYLWIEHERFHIELYPNSYGRESFPIRLFIESPSALEDEFECAASLDVVEILRGL